MKRTAVFDIECYRNFFYLAFRDVEKETVIGFEFPLDLPKIRRILETYRIVGFNSETYDVPLILYALKGSTEEQLKIASDYIITRNAKRWTFERVFGVSTPEALDHIDLIHVAPLVGSLKMYAARLHSPSIQDLPLPPETIVTEEEKAILREYCANDLNNTLLLFRALSQQIDLRQDLGTEYKLDLRSKSDAQMAEAVITAEVERAIGRKVEKPGIRDGALFAYRVPAWVNFEWSDVLSHVKASVFSVSDKGNVIMPDQLRDLEIKIGTGVYRMGIGGLHSSEKTRTVEADAGHRITDFDVTAYYPSILLNEGLFPSHIGEVFLKIYRGLVARRLSAKAAGQKAISESLKIVCNGTFGKLANQYSVLYSPDLFVQIVVTGQLALLMLIEMLNDETGVEVLSANTDGITLHYANELEESVVAVVRAWEKVTGFSTERADYQILASRDVNGYIALMTNGAVKTKGPYGKGLPLHGNPHGSICSKAVIDYLQLSADIGETVRQCQDIKEFIFARKVTGGATWRGQEIGKVVRWIYATGTSEPMYYKLNGNLVPRSAGALPLVQLPDRIPDNLDREWYIKEAQSMLVDLGVTS